MSDEIIPDDIRQFIMQSIDSIAHMEALLLFRNQPETQWDAVAIARRLYMTEKQVQSVLDQFVNRSIISRLPGKTPLYQYKPSSQELAAIIDKTVNFYGRFLVPITHLIHSKAQTRVQAFADAFRIRKD
jgi:hypothetical protein